jgi:dihydropteroate synthase
MKIQPNKYKKKLLISLEKHFGIVTPACKEVGVSRDTFYRYYNEDEDFKKAVDEINDIQGDFVEGKLFEKIKEGSERSIMFYMRYKGKKRGYSDSVDITSNGKDITYVAKFPGLDNKD